MYRVKYKLLLDIIGDRSRLRDAILFKTETKENEIKAFNYKIVLVACSVRDKIKELHLSLSSMDVVKGD
jgi:hypothetical protein